MIFYVPVDRILSFGPRAMALVAAFFWYLAVALPLGAATISTSSSPVDAGTTSGGGIYDSGASVTVSATAGDGYAFSNWTENGSVVSTLASYTFTVTGDRSLVAVFNPVVATPVFSPPGGDFTGSVVVTVTTATPGATIRYTTNGSEPTSTSATYTGPTKITNSVTLKAKGFKNGYNPSATATAIFTKEGGFNIVANPSPSNGGTITGAGEYPNGTSATLTATPKEGFTFVNWTENGTVVSTSPTYTFTVTANRTLAANFSGTAVTRVISLSGNMSFGGAKPGAQKTSVLTIRNSGNSALNVTGIAYPSGFSGAWSGFIQPGGAQTVTVTFAPLKTISYGGDIRVSSNATAGTYISAASGFGNDIQSDFNNDIKPDYVLTNTSSRKTTFWYLNNAAFAGSAWGPVLPAGWTLVDTADFNGDGKPDYALFNPSTRQTTIWYLNGPTFIGSAWGPTIPVDSVLTAVADFNGDLKPDFVLVNQTTRETRFLYLNNATFIKSASGPVLAAGYTLEAVADFNRDGQPDFVLVNASTLKTTIWYLSGNSYASSVWAPALASGYKLAGAEDFNADGKPDYVLVNSANLKTTIWYLNNATFTGSAWGPNLAAGYILSAP